MSQGGGYLETLPEFDRSWLAAVASGSAAAFEPLWPVAVPAPPEPEPVAHAQPRDIEAEQRRVVEDAYARGVADGRASRESELEDVVAVTIAEAERTAAAARAEFLATEAARIAVAIEEGLRRVADELDAATVAAIGPLIGPRLADALVADALAALQRSIDLNSASSVRISGPKELVANVSAALGARGIAARIDETTDVELSIGVDGAIVRTRIAAWVRMLEGALQ